MAKIEHKQLVGEEGFVMAAEAIADQIKNRVNKKDQVLKGAENWLSGSKTMNEIRALFVSGSPKFDFSDADFGWGRPRKLEVVSIDEEKYSMSLCKSRDSDGGLEVGMSLPKARMEAFAAIFYHGLT
ncbi:Malonyl-coenzyme:anthocyanin 5-O-glucoside-6'''-O-malonyltransferase [Sesamum alatum]|uniref:Malonyl-coenzyme:anthocyanin 5-O-glucoside-6'''-O-malonyltransferase n=1 Tax=Sesamum alatum TaxID=300844 RepID=A0AAE2CI19_9LAMI|nr:Malonyl-coenzyme:anthocyanin 5-O-glucoside-6'''-O-malonyltransferase [Sesamum alatum]